MIVLCPSCGLAIPRSVDVEPSPSRPGAGFEKERCSSGDLNCVLEDGPAGALDGETDGLRFFGGMEIPRPYAGLAELSVYSLSDDRRLRGDRA